MMVLLYAAETFGAFTVGCLAIIGLQKTGLDEVASLRIWGLCDEVRPAAREDSSSLLLQSNSARGSRAMQP